MTEITLKNDKDNIIFEASGHAEYSSDGNDIVCAAVSTLTGTFATLVSSLPVDAAIDAEDGYFRCCIPKAKLGIYVIDIIKAVEFMMIGLKQLEMQYPQHVILLEG